MVTVKLITERGHDVATLLVPPFKTPPAVVVWGSRVFVRDPLDDLDPLVFVERFAYWAGLEGVTAADAPHELGPGEALVDASKLVNAKGCAPQPGDLVYLKTETAELERYPFAHTATHRCKICGALWRSNPPTEFQPGGSWSCVQAAPNLPAGRLAGDCCDNVAMGDQIEAL